MWSEEVQMCLRRMQSQGLPGTGMKEPRPSSWSANEAGATVTGPEALHMLGGPGRVYGEGARTVEHGVWVPRWCRVTWRLSPGQGGRPGLRAKAHCAGVRTGGGPRHFLVHGCIATQSTVQMYVKEGRQVPGLTKQCDTSWHWVRDPDVGVVCGEPWDRGSK